MKAIACCASIFVLLIAEPLAAHAQQRANSERVARPATVPSRAAGDDCEARMQKLDASDAEGEERLAVKNEVIERCEAQYKHDRTIERLVNECAKYVEQPVVKQQLVAECQLAAFNYANALHTLTSEYRK